jgi:lipopolysaccharide transport system ATP-binding protein
MSDIAIHVENLSKQYRIGGSQAPYKTFRESLTEAVQAPFRRVARLLRGQAYGAAEMDETIWALKDVSFEVQRGEVVGIIGRNGAGKTTLLKILSRITGPTEGQAEIHGRVGSLLEVGTGFHPELTGRDNIYLNGAILGMKRVEIGRKFDEIVDFSGVEKFIDTPVKRYSSGMYVRLAFAVAAHLDPEILLVDEVLAVGDVEFQKKCLGKMDEVAGAGRTVLLVSHNLGSIGKLCRTALLLEQGHLVFSGDAGQVIARYLQGTNGVDQAEFLFPADEAKTMCIRAIRVLDHEGNPATSLDLAHPFRVEITYQVHEQMNDTYVSAVMSRIDIQTRIYNTRDIHAAPKGFVERGPGTYVSTVEFPGGILNVGTYRVGIGLHKSGMPAFDSQGSPSFSLIDSGYASDYRLRPAKRGLLALTPKWTTEILE